LDNDEKHTTNDIKLPFSVEDLRELNYGLADYYEKEIIARSDPSVELELIIGNTSKCKKETYYWTTYVRPVDKKTKLIQSVLFKLQPPYDPVDNLVESAPYEISSKGSEAITIEIVITDILGYKHQVSHELNFEENLEKNMTIQIKTDPNQILGEGIRMNDAEEVSDMGMHGFYGVGKEWKAPFLVTYCDVEARKGYNSMKAHEYSEDPETLRLKIKVFADLLRVSEHCVAYTGAGISTASGINDYASQSKDSLATGKKDTNRPKTTGLCAQPTFAHRVMVALHKGGMLKHWVQQNHDGLPQKAGYPQQALNEIHGGWFDPSNPVVPMDGTLRGDLFQWMQEEEQAADLVIAMGTSLCGMNSDRMVKTPAKKFINKSLGLGSVIIGFQRTALDDVAALRIFARIDEVMLLLALEMNLPVSFAPYFPDIPDDCRVEDHVFLVPYLKSGENNDNSSAEKIQWNLKVGTKLRLTGGPGVGFEGFVVHTPDQCKENAYIVQFPCTREKSKEFGKIPSKYCLGTWFVEAACKGLIPLLPVINIDD
jgi:NAD-dependent SIR2 family protein deacetylase/transcription initiation factor IIF auxiliary subunit